MINRYYQLPAWTTGIGDFLTSFALTRKAKNEAESGLRAQASQQTNQAWAGAAGNIGGGIIGGLVAKNAPDDLTNLQRFQLASSFVPSMGRTTQVLGDIAGMQSADRRQAANIQAAQDLERLRTQGDIQVDAARTQGDVYRAGVAAYIKQYGTPPATTADAMQALASEAGQPMSAPGANMADAATGTPMIAQPGSLPVPAINPAMTPQYRAAEQLVYSFDNALNNPAMLPGQRADMIRQLGPQVDQARQLLQRSQPPGPPTTIDELQQSGRVIPDGKGGAFYMSAPDKMSHVMAPKSQPDAVPIPRNAEEAQAYIAGRYGTTPDGTKVLIQPDGKLVPVKDDDGDEVLQNIFDAQVKQEGRVDVPAAMKQAEEIRQAQETSRRRTEDIAKLNDALKDAVNRPAYEGITEKEFAQMFRDIARIWPNPDDHPQYIRDAMQQLDRRLHRRGTAALITGPS